VNKRRFSWLLAVCALLLVTCGVTPTPLATVPAQSVSAQAPTATYLPLVENGGKLNAWTQGPGTKVQPTTQPGSEQAIALEGARGAYESYQVIITAGSQDLSDVSLAASELSDGSGHTIPAKAVVFFRQVFIDFTGVEVSEHGNLEVPENSPTGDGRLPDALVPFIDPYSGSPAGAPFSVAANTNQPVWVDVSIPAEAVGGAYKGQVSVLVDGEAVATIPLTLTVWDFSLPDMRAVTTYFGMYMNDVIQFHSGTWDCSGSNCWLDWNARARTIVQRYEELAHEHRMGTWQNFVPDPSNDCQPPSDWSDYDQAMQAYMDGSYWQDGIPSSWIEMPFSPGVDWGPEECPQDEYTALAAAWAGHLKEKGWFDAALVYAYDEPSPEALAQIAQDSQWMQAGDPDWKAKIMDTTEPTAGTADLLNPALGIYCVALKAYDDWDDDGSTPPDELPYGREEWPGLFAQGIQLWFYESNAQGAPYPTFATNTLLGNEPRSMLWGAWYEQASGFLLWDTTAWDTSDPWGPNVRYGKTGDGVLIYPGNHDGLMAPGGSPADVAIDGPIPSYRMKVIRLGLQDWALFKLAEQYGLGDYARQQVAQAYGQLGGCTWEGCPAPENGEFFWKADDALMMQIRHNIAQALMSAMEVQP
jgi:hypothetical protein